MSSEKEKLKNIPKDSGSYEAFLQKKAISHSNLRYYAKRQQISEIVNEGVLRLSDGHNWNDRFDSSLFNSPEYEDIQFGKCFCFSKSESVAMWKIYAGDSDGCLIDFKKQLPNIVNETTQICLKYFDGKDVCCSKNLSKPDFRIILCDVLYISPNTGGTYTVKRSDERIDEVPEDVIEPILTKCKNMPWSYENECRLIICVKKSLLEGTRYNVAEIKIPPAILTKLKKNVVVSPNYVPNGKETLAFSHSILEGNVVF